MRRIENSIASLTKKIDDLAAKVESTSKFQDSFQAVSKVLSYACTIVAALAVIYGVFR